MNFIQLIIFFLALNLVPEDTQTFTLQSGEDRYVVTRSADAKAGWDVAKEGEEDAGNTVSVQGTTMHVRYDGQVTINFMHQYVAADDNTNWAKIKSISLKALQPPSDIAISRSKDGIKIRHKHKEHGFEAHIAW